MTNFAEAIIRPMDETIQSFLLGVFQVFGRSHPFLAAAFQAAFPKGY